jgi:hypothetical protein
MTRDDLIYALTLAAELEHSLCCQYLFSAYSMKKDPEEGLTWQQISMVRDWQSTILLIGRQEMEHMGLVNNLLTAIGGAPHFRRPNFPQPASAYGIPIASRLQAFSLEALDRFIEFEQPDELPAVDAGAFRVPTPPKYESIQELYGKIHHAFKTIPERELFIGPPSAQVDSAAIGLVNDKRAYDVVLFPVTNRSSALKAIELIVLEGEGVPIAKGVDPKSHYARLLDIREQYIAEVEKHPDFVPARPVIDNPLTREDHREAVGGNLITDPFSLNVAHAFNTAYEALLFALIRFYARTDETDDELQGLQQTAFFPLMVMALRPLAEVLMTLPAGDAYEGKTAGPSFEFYRSIQYLPHKHSAWIVLHEKLLEMHTRLARLAEARPEITRLAFIRDNFERIAMNFARYMNLADAERGR